MKKTILCLLLALGLLLMSAAALADSDPANYSFDINEGSIIIADGVTPGMVTVTYGSPQRTTAEFDPRTHQITVTGRNPTNSPQLFINTQEPVSILYSVTIYEEDPQSTIRIGDNADVTLIPNILNCAAYGKSEQPGIALGSGSKLTIQANDSRNWLYLFGRESGAILGPIDDDETPATVILNSGRVLIHRYNPGSGISGNVNLVINGGGFNAKSKDINVQSLIVIDGQLWATENYSLVTYGRLASKTFDNISCENSILPHDTDNINSLCVFGNLTLPFDLTIPDGKTLDLIENNSLTIPEDRSLTCNTLRIMDQATLTNQGTLTINQGTTDQESFLNSNGKLNNKGTLIINTKLSIKSDNALTNNGTISGSGSITPPERRLTLQQPASLTVESIENGAVTLSAPANANAATEYCADGTNWQESPKFTGVDLGAGRTFSARYKANNFFKASGETSITVFPVSLNANGGTIASGKDVTYYIDGLGAMLPDDVERPGYTFAGWYDNAALAGSPVTAIGTDETDHREFWAGWIAAPVITSPAEDTTVTVYEGEQATMTIAAKNAAAYQWFMSTDGGASWTECGTNSPTYTTSPTKLENNGYQYMCVVTGSNELDKEELPPKEEIPPEGAVMSLRSRSRSTDDGLTGNTPAVESPIFTLEVIRKDVIPQTGDTSRPAAWLALLGACCAGLWRLSRRRG